MIETAEGIAVSPEGIRKDVTYEGVKERLVEARQFWWRINRRGAWPFAGDGPWNLIQAEWGDYADEDAELRPLPLTRPQIARMKEALEWLLLVPTDDDRKLVCLAIEKLARGHKRVPWRDLLKPMGHRHGADQLRMRFQRAVALIARSLPL
jgi:hypothetical protein